MTLLLKVFSYGVIFIALLVLISVAIYAIKKPSNNKNWSLGNSKTSSIEIDSNNVKIKNYRDADWNNLDLSEIENDNSFYRELDFQLTDIESLHVVVSHFAILSEIAHIFIFFELKDKTMLGLSVEARKEKGEEYSLSGGLSAKFELIYLMASYRDLVGLRLMRNEAVYQYPISATAEESQALFKVLTSRINTINKKPELYHLFLKNCTTEIVKLVNQIADKKFPRFTQSFFPGDAGKALYKMGLIDSTATFDEIQNSALIKK